jgi:hypothetical protein
MPTYPPKKGGSVVTHHDPIDPADPDPFTVTYPGARPITDVSLPTSVPDSDLPVDVDAVPEADIVMLSNRLGHLRAAKRDIEAEEQSIRTAIIDHLEAAGESQVFTASGQVAATLRISVRSGINRSKLEALYPEVFANVVTATRVKSIWLP